MHDCCGLCDKGASETLDHIFVQCEWAQRCWFVSDLTLRTGGISLVRDWCARLLDSQDRELPSRVFMLAWARNLEAAK